MLDRSDLTLAEQLAATQDWWREAGVDCVFVDEPQALLKPAVDEAAAAPESAAQAIEAPAPPPPLLALDLPGDLAAFGEWWVDPASPLPGPPLGRIGPRGAVEAPLMVLVPMPEGEDRDSLLSGAQGRLVRNMLRALGLGEDEAYIATALPATMALPDWEALAASGLGAVVRHHVALARPKRLLLLGNGLPVLLGLDGPQRTAIPTEQGDMPVLTAFAPDQLLGHPRQMARLWQRLLDWMPPL